MRKFTKVGTTLAITGAVSLSFTLGAMAATKVSLFYNGKQKSTSIKVINNNAYVPLKDAVSWFNGKVTYDKKNNKYTVTSKDYKPATPTSKKSYTVNLNKTSGAMKLHISKVTIDSKYKEDEYSTPIKAIILDVKVTNTSTKKLRWHLDNGLYALNTGEQIDSAYSSDVDDNFLLGGVTKSGKVVLEVKSSNLDSINSIKFDLDSAYDADYNDIGTEQTFDLKFR
ncbi:hypothetical protein E2K98_04605 [Bacillus salipaludis]|uniref:DUF4352 domain-containing protein n=1 Tax=Bacillus salipaludis TaxID=2547811 RepID=A0A4R5VZX1_9BACI|nr:hypothetical protein [Bacillus salipaludis]TDK64148.1 hypothetical protein E2K98_04605 [Bacillus salipaludis]